MDVYDFDGTVYSGDSTVDFFLFCLLRHPSIICELPAIEAAAIRYKRRLVDKRSFKETFHRFVRHLPDTAEEVGLFWKSHETKVGRILMPQKDDVIASASAAFLLDPICEAHGWNLVASAVDSRTGTYLSENCYGTDKAKMFDERFPRATVSRFYSDSLSDTPLARRASEAFLVGKTGVAPWPEDALASSGTGGIG